MQPQLATAPTENPPSLRASQTIAWTPAQVEFLRQRWNENATAAQIAEELGFGCTKNMVIGKAGRLGLAPHQSRPPRGGVGALDQARAAVPKNMSPAPRVPSRRNPISKAAIAKPKPIVSAITCEPAPEGGISVIDLERHHCRWILGGEAEHARYCGAGRVEGKAFAYCAKQYAIAAVPAAASRVEREVRAAMRGRG